MAQRNVNFLWVILLLIVFTIIMLHSFQNEKQELGIFNEVNGLENVNRCHNSELQFGKIRHGDYWVMKNLIMGEKSRYMGCAESITYTTNGDYRFIKYVETVAKRWLAPISFAIYAPGHDLNSTLDAIQHVRNCLPDSQLIVDYVSFHIYFPSDHMPEYIPLNEEDVLHWPIECGENVRRQTETQNNLMYRQQFSLTYPINVGRNIARLAVNTHFILACDIELIPSKGFVDQFLNMVKQNPNVLTAARRVYPLPVFEIIKGSVLPEERSELVAGVRAKRIRVFHSRICLPCHNVPKLNVWLYNKIKFSNELRVFSATRREKVFRHWEPVYVSDNTEPLFDERVTWEGQNSKRLQAFAMCLLGYEFHVLYPAFLVHQRNFIMGHQDPQRRKHAKDMQRLIRFKFQPEYRVLYGNKSKCRL